MTDKGDSNPKTDIDLPIRQQNRIRTLETPASKSHFSPAIEEGMRSTKRLSLHVRNSGADAKQIHGNLPGHFLGFGKSDENEPVTGLVMAKFEVSPSPPSRS